jgi:carbonic anhydrase
MEGNRRFAKENSAHPNRCHETRMLTSKRQKPFAAILTCSDSRVSPEIIFDQGIGDLFIVRVAGNVAGPLEIASLNFGVHALGSELVLVLGHENCGAIQAVLKGQGELIAPIADLIQIGSIRKEPDAIKHNAKNVASCLKEKLSVHVACGYYHLTTGQVELY